GRQRDDDVSDDGTHTEITHKNSGHEVKIECAVQSPVDRAEQYEDIRYKICYDHLATSCTQYAQKKSNHARHFPAKYASICSSVTSAISLPASRAFSHSTVFCTATER